MLHPTFIIMHHSLTKDGKTVSWQAIKRYHMTDPDHMWSDIGYHFGCELVNNDYEILTGRPINIEGAHCKPLGMNHKSLGFMLAGNFEENEPPIQQWNLSVKYVRGLCIVLGIPYINVLGHRETSSLYECPGRFFDMGKFRADLKRGV